MAFSSAFGVSVEVGTLSTSLFVLGYAFGPLVWAPFSELQGRKLPICIGMLGFTIFTFGCAAGKDIQTIMLCRFFTGFFGSCPLAVVAAVFADMFDNTQRGIAIVIFASTVFMGPMLGPFIGGFIQASYLGWRWNLYLPGIMGACAFILNVLFLQESYAPVVLVSKASELRRRTKNWGIHAKQEEVEVDLRELVTKNFSRPIRLLISEPIILLITIYMSFIYGLLYCFLTAYPLVFSGVHHIKPGVAGSAILRHGRRHLPRRELHHSRQQAVRQEAFGQWRYSCPRMAIAAGHPWWCALRDWFVLVRLVWVTRSPSIGSRLRFLDCSLASAFWPSSSSCSTI